MICIFMSRQTRVRFLIFSYVIILICSFQSPYQSQTGCSIMQRVTSWLVTKAIATIWPGNFITSSKPYSFIQMLKFDFYQISWEYGWVWNLMIWQFASGVNCTGSTIQYYQHNLKYLWFIMVKVSSSSPSVTSWVSNAPVSWAYRTAPVA